MWYLYVWKIGYLYWFCIFFCIRFSNFFDSELIFSRTLASFWEIERKKFFSNILEEKKWCLHFFSNRTNTTIHPLICFVVYSVVKMRFSREIENSFANPTQPQKHNNTTSFWCSTNLIKAISDSTIDWC